MMMNEWLGLSWRRWKNMHSFGFNVGYGGHRRKAYFKIYLGYMLNKYGL